MPELYIKMSIVENK